MSWETPELVEINLDAEIGSYQDDFGDEPPREPLNEPDVDAEPA